MRRRLLAATAAMAVTMVAACATLPDDPEERAEAEAVNDPLEPSNRAVYDFNMYLDSNVAEPVAQAYHDNVPDWFRQAVHNLLANLSEPYTAGNDLLQGNPEAAADALGRFFINSTFGMLGTQDVVAETGGPKRHKTDLGVTFAVWGVDEGPYLMLPLLGPSNIRDGAGRVADYFVEPTGVVMGAQGLDMVGNVTMGADILDTRSENLANLREIKRTSIDEYAAIRSLYRQFRDASIKAAREGQKETHAPHPTPDTTGAPAGTVASAATKPATGPASPASTGGASSTPTKDAGQGGAKETDAKPSAVEFVEPGK
jgi:phospholipid-binding lipoprotein MlaA